MLIAASAGGWVAGTHVESPEQAAAGAQPPEPSVLTARVERRTLEKTLTLRGNVTQQHLVAINPTIEEGDAVVTGLFLNPGDAIENGARPIEVSARPVFVMPGAVPMFRSLRPGMSGPDVKQLQVALAQLGYSVAPDGVYATETKAAVARWYSEHGYDAQMTSPTAKADLSAAKRAVEAAEARRDTARAAYVAATEPSVADLKVALDLAESDLTAERAIAAELERTTGVMVPRSELVFVPDLPGRVVSAKSLGAGAGGGAEVPRTETGDVGASSGGGVMTIASGPVEFTALVPVGDQELVTVGKAALAAFESGDEQAEAEVISVATEISTGTDGSKGVSISLVPTDQRAQPAVGTPVTITIVVASTGDSALVVPSSAVFAASDRQMYVTVVDDVDKERKVAVTTGISADGYVEIQPRNGATLNDGDDVLIGKA